MNYVRIIRIVLFGALTLSVQGENADVSNVQTKVGVCNYRSKSDLLEDAPQDIIRRNVNYYQDMIRKAGSENAKIVVFPEGGLTTLTPFHENREVYFKYSLNMSDWKDSCPCDDDIWNKKGIKGAAIAKLSCAAKSNQVHVVVNILEKEFVVGNSYHIYNTNLVFNNSGYIIVRYRKVIPGITNRTQDIEIKDENEFTVSDRKYKTIIGTDIYNEHINFFATDNTVSIVWSTASKKNCTELPAVALAQIFERENKIIYIADYGDDLWSSSCSYYNGNLYTSFGDQSADYLILVPSDEFNIARQELKANCFIKYILNHVNTTSLDAIEGQKEYGTCKISYNKSTNNKYSAFFIVATKERKEISLCGIAAVNKDADNLDYEEIFKELTIKWYNKNDECNRSDYYIPITADTRYWPLQIGKYIYKQGPPGELSLNKTAFAIFALMRVTDMNANCTKIYNDVTLTLDIIYYMTVFVIFFLVVFFLYCTLDNCWTRYLKKTSPDINKRPRTDDTTTTNSCDDQREEWKNAIPLMERSNETVD